MIRRRASALIAALVGLLLAAGCTSPLGVPLDLDDGRTPPPTVPVRTSRGCTNGAPARGPGTTTETIEVDGIVRTFLLTIPDVGTGDGARPLVLDFHGSGSNGTQQFLYSRLATKGQTRGYVTITPTANGPIWAIPPSPVDLHLVDAVLEWIGGRACIDLRRIYAAGLSNGASMTGGLGCHRRDVFAAIGMVAGPNIYPTCTDQRPMPLIAFHGTADHIVPYQAGLALGTYPVRGVEDVVREIALDRNLCQDGPIPTFLSPDVTRVLYRSCAMQGDVHLYAVIGGGHTWPGAAFDVPALGPVTRTVDASDLMLDFFDAHTR